jgi:hypothetical protein
MDKQLPKAMVIKIFLLTKHYILMYNQVGHKFKPVVIKHNWIKIATYLHFLHKWRINMFLVRSCSKIVYFFECDKWSKFTFRAEYHLNSLSFGCMHDCHKPMWSFAWRMLQPSKIRTHTLFFRVWQDCSSLISLRPGVVKFWRRQHLFDHSQALLLYYMCILSDTCLTKEKKIENWEDRDWIPC